MIRRWVLTFAGLMAVTFGLLLAGAPAQAHEALTQSSQALTQSSQALDRVVVQQIPHPENVRTVAGAVGSDVLVTRADKTADPADQRPQNRGGNDTASTEFIVVGMVVLVLIALGVVLLVRALIKKMDGDET